jgi:hypothetical protein
LIPVPVIGILTCEILELEFAHLLRSDPEIRKITVVEDDYSAELIQLLEQAGRPIERIERSGNFVRSEPQGLEVLIRVLELGLHNRKRLLQEGLAAAGREMGPHIDIILLGYGLCGNALVDPVALLAEAGVPVIIPMDADHPVDDCVGLIIGGREAYYEEQCRVAGTFFMIPGWTRHWKHIFRKEHGGWSEELARRLFTGSGYERSLLVPNGLLSEEEMGENIAEFNRMFGFRTEVQQGSLELLRRSWAAAKLSL